MGQSTDGIYFYGLCSSDEELELGDYEEWAYEKQQAFENEYGIVVRCTTWQ